ncbi:hypothetical protein Leryth_022851 [Lithospermum erythrorhizon]|nr:hypothetical protein Leryth_022851 [Lithospermum erythrorhizon]
MIDTSSHHKKKISKMAQILLHGTLHATIYEIDKLDAGFAGELFHKHHILKIKLYVAPIYSICEVKTLQKERDTTKIL